MVTVRAADPSDPGRPPHAAARTHAPRAAGKSRLLLAITEIVERRDTVRFGPHADFPGILEGAVLPVQHFLAVVGPRELSPLEFHPQRVPLVGRHLYTRALPLGSAPVDGVVNRDVVFERVGSGNVVIFRVFQAPHDTAGLVFFSRERLELHLYETVF